MINWQRVLLNLRSHHGPIARVAKDTGLDYAHLSRLARGEVAEPRFNSGLKLLDLHAVACRELHRLEVIGE